ncbi:hypothetical protein GCM10010275_63710 [Streptomyces litmocidini]|uniref:hypothetical protein n=1 Tax=Streptomyces litmocidini TaxID=67318 RepID=UPI00167C7744|nr:hypothetical protein [Streptomyces litmocidini]GGV13766.1 hypothetical protein GCM10010275_63710 [Streptomyces litmocidini]
MDWFLGLGIAGLVLLVLALVFDGVLEGVLDSLGGGLDGFLSLPVIAGFVSALGFTGAIVLGSTGTGAGVATGAGVVAGGVAGWGTRWFSRALMRDGSAPAPRGEDLTGTSGSVVTAIPTDGYGEVLLYLGGQPVKYAARSAVSVARGAEVWVESVLSPSSVAVRPVEH